MIRMNRHTHALRAEETDQFLRLLSPLDLQAGADLVALVVEARAGNGHVPFREHDLAVLIERRRNGVGTLTPQQMALTLDELEAMG